jgi:hypothetical protein
VRTSSIDKTINEGRDYVYRADRRLRARGTKKRENATYKPKPAKANKNKRVVKKTANSRRRVARVAPAVLAVVAPVFTPSVIPVVPPVSTTPAVARTGSRNVSRTGSKNNQIIIEQ